MYEQMLKEYTEVEIQMPWGHISGKWWGAQNRRPIIAIHGWQDNAGTFDTLVPLIQSKTGVLALDLPGHGLSSPFPRGLMLHITNFVYNICQIMEKYNWKTISILGHSMGSTIGFILAALFPEKVDFLIGLDAYKPLIFFEDNFSLTMSRSIKAVLITEKRNNDGSEPPSYCYEECVERLHAGSENSINRDKCHHILERNIRKSKKIPDRYYFGRDSRLKYAYVGVWPQKMYSKLLKSIQCPILYIRALDSPLTDKIENHNENMAILKEKPNFEYYEVEGTHHVHLNEPQKVSALINKFLSKQEQVEIIESKL